MIENPPGQSRLAIFPAGERRDIAHRNLAADGFQPVAGHRSPVDTVTQRTVGMIPIGKDVEFPGRSFHGIRPGEISECVVGWHAGRKEKHLSSGV